MKSIKRAKMATLVFILIDKSKNVVLYTKLFRIFDKIWRKTRINGSIWKNEEIFAPLLSRKLTAGGIVPSASVGGSGPP